MDIHFHSQAFDDYQYFQQNDRRIVDKINNLLKDISRTSFTGIGKPEPLKHNLTGFWSRRINSEHRLVYAIKNNAIYVLQCRYHY